MIGHNAYSFDDVVAENMERGVLLAQRDCAARALRDPMLSQRHRVVLAEIILLANPRGVASPRRATLAERTGYTSSGIAKTVGELVEWGYVVSVRKSPAKGERALAHYAVVKPTIEELQQAITAHIDALRRDYDASARITDVVKSHADERIPIDPELRLTVLLSTSGCCTYCGATIVLGSRGKLAFHVDHAVPVARGGQNDLSNLRAACAACNLSKGKKTEDEFIAARKAVRS